MKDPPGKPVHSASEEGFSANLTGANLPDLVQLECIANSTLVVRVVSGDDQGYLYFHAGQIVHAMSSNALGEPAALEILGWNRGSFEPCNAGWPSSFTISKPWQALLMSSAAARDEERRKVVDFPRERSQGASMSQKPPIPVASQPPISRSPVPTPMASPSQSGMAPSTRGIDRAVRLESDGRVLSTRGDADELAAMTAYALRVSALVGEELGMGELRAVESVSNGTRRLFYTEAGGNLIGLEAASEIELGPLREKLGL
jgi:predicted regulator of Ras-like GTPase activity (Roadblock/LC7/MglB family)